MAPAIAPNCTPSPAPPPCRALSLRHLRTRAYRPQTNGKAERFIRTLLAGWAYGAIYRDSTERSAALAGWIETYNHRRPHGALSHKSPIARLNELNNPLGSYTGLNDAACSRWPSNSSCGRRRRRRAGSTRRSTAPLGTGWAASLAGLPWLETWIAMWSPPTRASSRPWVGAAGARARRSRGGSTSR